MANRFLKRFFLDARHTKNAIIKNQEAYRRFVYGILSRFQSQDASNQPQNDAARSPHDLDYFGYTASSSSDGEAVGPARNSISVEKSNSKWRVELDWLSKALEPALQLCRWALPTESAVGSKIPPSNWSLSEIITSIQRSKIGIEGWSLSDLTIGLYLIYLRQASLKSFEDVKGVQVTSESIVQDLMYNLELAKGCYRDSTYGLAKSTMLRESNILKFVRNSSFMRPGYYVGIDPRKKLVILGIRGTQTVYDLITDIVSSGDEEVSFDGYSTHFGTAEAARWFLTHEMGTIRKCLERHEGFRLRLVGHSLGAATASVLAIMLRKKSPNELGFNPEIVTAVGYATPPCVSRELAESCSDFVKTVVMQDDIVPRLSAASLERLRTEILQTDWMSVVEKEDWKKVTGLVANAKQVMASVQEVAKKLADYARFGSMESSPVDGPIRNEACSTPKLQPLPGATSADAGTLDKRGDIGMVYDELFVPGAVYYLKKDIEPGSISHKGRGMELFTLWERHPGEHFQRIVLSSNIVSDHKCDSHYHALRDVIKGFPGKTDEGIFQM